MSYPVPNRKKIPIDIPPLKGGITKYAPKRLDLLVREIACAGADRAANAHANLSTCPDADVKQILEFDRISSY